MSKKDKLIDRLLKRPADFTFDEMKSLLAYFGYDLKQGGTGSGVKYIKKGMTEKQIAWEIERYFITNGADGLSFDTIVASRTKFLYATCSPNG